MDKQCHCRYVYLFYIFLFGIAEIEWEIQIKCHTTFSIYFYNQDFSKFNMEDFHQNMPAYARITFKDKMNAKTSILFSCQFRLTKYCAIFSKV